MSTTFYVQWDSRELRVFRNGAVDKAILRSALKAGNRALRDLRAEAKRQVTRRKKIKSKNILRDLPIVFPRRKGELQSLIWEMKVQGRMMPVTAYPYRQVRGNHNKPGGVMVEINPGSQKLIRGAFIATLRSGHKGVFLRRGTARLPIDELFTSRIVDVFADEDLIPQLEDYTAPRMEAEFARLLELELSKLGR